MSLFDPLARDEFIHIIERDLQDFHGLLGARKGDQQVSFVLDHVRIIDPADHHRDLLTMITSRHHPLVCG